MRRKEQKEQQKRGVNILILLCFTSFFIPCNLEANPNEDSLVQVLEDYYLERKYNKISDDLNMHYDISGSKKVELSKRFLIHSRSKQDLLYSSLYLGISYYQIGEIDSALFVMNKAMQYVNYSKLKELSSDFHAFTGKIYSQQQNFDLAQKKIVRSIDLARQAGVESKIIRGEVELGNIFFFQGKIDDALPHFYTAKAFFEDQKNIPNTQIAKTYIALCYFRKKEFQTALQLFHEIDSVTKCHNLDMIRSTVVSNQGFLYLEMKDYDKAIDKTREAFTLTNEIKDEYAMVTIEKAMADAFVGKLQYDSAFYHLRIADSISDKLYNENYLETIEELETNYKVQQEQHKISILEKDRVIEAQDYQRMIHYYILALIGLSLLSALVFMWFQRQKIKTEKKLQYQKNKRNQAQYDLYTAQRELLSFKTLVTEKDQLISKCMAELSRTQINDVKSKRTELEKMLILTKDDIENFKSLFDSAYPGFLDHLTSTKDNLSQNDQILMILIFLNIKSKTQSNMLGISIDSLRKARYRLKKKLVPKDSEYSDIREYIEIMYKEFFQSSLISKINT